MNKRIAMSLAALSLVSAVALAGCGGGSSGSGSNEVVVNMKSTAFEKGSIEIKAGQTVKWVNQDVVDHSVFEGEPESGKYLFKSEDYGEGKSFSYTFDKPGEYNIFCNTGGHHLIGMKMKVVVK